MKSIHVLALSGALGLVAALVGCGGQNAAQPAPVPGLKYTNPPATGYRLVQASESTGQRLVLELVGPNGDQIQGISLSLAADGQKATWESTVREGGALDLGSGTKLMKVAAQGGNLELGMFQKGRSAAVLGGLPIARTALVMQPGAAKGPIALSAAQAQVLDGTGNTVSVTVNAGTLSVE